MTLAVEIDRRIQKAIDENDLEELHRLLEELYRESDDADRPFDAAIELKPDFRDELGGDGFEGDAAINWANRIARGERLVQYRLKILTGFRGARIVSEGDSWFQYPLLLKDVIDNFIEQRDFATYSLGAAGDLVEHMAIRREYHAALGKTKSRVLLLSGGGNDLLGEGRLFDLLNPYEDGASAEELLNREALAGASRQIMGFYKRILEDVRVHHPGVTVFGHGYDTPFPRAGKKHFGKPFEQAGIPLDVGRDVIKAIVEFFRTELAGLTGTFSNYRFIDLTGTVGGHPNAWYDELHPKSPGYAKAAKPLIDAVREHLDGLSGGGLFESAVVEEGGFESGTRALIVLDPGHGGSESLPGSSWNNAIGPEGSLEKVWTLDVAKRTKDVLEGRGHRVRLTRDTDVNVSSRGRRDVARTAQADVFVSIHFNASSAHNAQGIETYVHPTTTSARSIRLMRSVQASMVRALGHRDRNASRAPDGILRGRYGVINEGGHDPATAVCLHEVSFMDRIDEERRIKDPAYRDRIATALADGIEACLAGETGFESETLLVASADEEFEDAIQEAAARAGMSVFQHLGFAEATPTPEPTPAAHVDGSALFESTASGPPSGLVQAVFRDLAGGAAVADEPDAGEGAFIDSSGGLDLSTFGQDPARDMEMLKGAFGGLAADGFESGGFDFAEFSAFVAGLGLQHFKAAELLYMGSSNQSGRCRNTNAPPPKSLWPNIANTARMLDRIRARLGHPIRILSAYRSPAYNTCLSGAGRSRHMEFNAIDFTSSGGSVGDWHRIATEVRASEPAFAGGVGRYDRQNFIHIDTRGSRADWTG